MLKTEIKKGKFNVLNGLGHAYGSLTDDQKEEVYPILKTQAKG